MSREKANAAGYKDCQMEKSRLRKLQVLQRAEKLLGREILAARLRVSPGVLEGWLRGDASVPDSAMLTLAAELVELAQPKR